LDTSIPALVIGAILLLGATFLSRSSITSYDRLGQQIKGVEARAGDQARTRLTITGATLDAPHVTLTLQIRNDGQTSLSAWEATDVIVTYTDASSARLTTYLTYTAGALADDTCTVTSISPDSFEPGILNPGETATLTIQVAPAVGAGTSNVVVIGTENGVTLSAVFTG
jgi:archaellum component FlaF (FlaF/FlaG flagellin family)